MTNVEVIVTAIGSPAVLAIISSWLNTRARRSDKKLDWEREDKVAQKAEEAATLLLASNKVVAKTAEITNGKLDVIHVLVNSNMTAAMQAQLIALKGQLILMHRVTDLNRQAGTSQTKDELAAIGAVDAQILELSASLKDRLQATERAASAGK